MKVSTDGFMLLLLRIPAEMNLLLKQKRPLSPEPPDSICRNCHFIAVKNDYSKLNSPNSPSWSFHCCNNPRLCFSQKQILSSLLLCFYHKITVCANGGRLLWRQVLFLVEKGFILSGGIFFITSSENLNLSEKTQHEISAVALHF